MGLIFNPGTATVILLFPEELMLVDLLVEIEGIITNIFGKAVFYFDNI